jgi:hypothetical protein
VPELPARAGSNARGENRRTERQSRNDAEQVEHRGLGTDLAQTFAQGTALGAGGTVGVAGAKKLIGLVGDAFKEQPSQVVLPPGVNKDSSD